MTIPVNSTQRQSHGLLSICERLRLGYGVWSTLGNSTGVSGKAIGAIVVVLAGLLFSSTIQASVALTPSKATLQSVYDSSLESSSPAGAIFTINYDYGDAIRAITLCEPSCSDEDSSRVVSAAGGTRSSLGEWSITHKCEEPRFSGIGSLFLETIPGLCVIEIGYEGYDSTNRRAELMVSAFPIESDGVVQEYTATLSGRSVDEMTPVIHEIEGTISFLEDYYDVDEGRLLQIPVERVESEVPFDESHSIEFYFAPISEDCCESDEPGGATENFDYRIVGSPVLQWQAGETSLKYLQVEILEDSIPDAGEGFRISIDRNSLGSNVIGEVNFVDVYIGDVEPPSVGPGEFSFTPTTLSGREGDTLNLRVTRSGTSAQLESNVDIELNISENLINDLSIDEVDESNLYWSGGESDEKTVRITLLTDRLEEGEESGLLIANIYEFYYDDDYSEYADTVRIPITIEDSTVPPLAVGTLFFDNTQLDVGENAGTVSLLVQRVGGADGAISVDYQFLDGTAENQRDFSAEDGTLNWADGSVDPQVIEFTILADADLESVENFQIALLNPRSPEGSDLVISSNRATVSIQDNTQAGELRFAAASARVQESSGEYTLNVERFNGSDGALSVDYEVIGNDAQPNLDFIAVSGTLSWANGEQGGKPVVVQLISDNLLEDDENFTIRLSNVVSIVQVPIANSEFNITIEDDSLPIGTISFLGDNVREVREGEQLTLSVIRSNGSAGPMSVVVETFSDTAQATDDFTPVSQTLRWADGNTDPKTIVVSALTDRIPDVDERFLVRMSSAEPNGVAVGNTSISVTIINDNGSPGFISFSSAQVTTQEDEETVVLFVQRVDGSEGEVKVNYTTVTDTAGEDDFSSKSGTLIWVDGDSASKPIAIGIKADSLNDEALEQFYVDLSGTTPFGDSIQLRNPLRATILLENVPVVIPLRNGGVLTLQTTVFSVDENAGSVSIPVARVGGSEGEVSLDYEVQDGSATTGVDFTATTGSLTWANGDTTTKVIEVPINTDLEVEGVETFSVVLSAPRTTTPNVRVILDTSSASINIVDTTAPGRIRFAMGTDGLEISEHVGIQEVQVERLDGSDGAVSIDYILTSRSAVVGTDVSVGDSNTIGGTLRWANGESGAQAIRLSVVADELPEGNEDFVIELINPQPSSVLIDAPQAILTLIDTSAGFTGDPVYNLTAGVNTELSGVPGQTLDALNVATSSNDSAGRLVEWRVFPTGAVEFLQGEPTNFGALTTIGQDGRSGMSLRILSRGFIQVIASPVDIRTDSALGSRALTARAEPARLETTNAEVLFAIRSGFQVAAGLSRSQSATGRSLDGACELLLGDTTGESLTAGQLDLLNTCERLQTLESDGDIDTLARALDRLAPEEVFYFSDAVVEVADIQVTNIHARINAVRGAQKTLNLVDASAFRLNIVGQVIPGFVINTAVKTLFSGGGAAADEGLALGSRWGFFANGELTVGEVDGNGEQRNADLSTRGITLGADYRVNKNVVVGAGLGIIANDADFTEEEGKASANGVNLSIFGSWYEGDEGYADAVLDIGSYSYDMRRRIDMPLSGQPRQFADGSTDSTTVSLTIGVGRNFDIGGWEFVPYGQMSLVSASVDGYSETLGSGGSAGIGSLLDIGSHSVRSSRFSLGAQVSHVLNTRRAVILPQLRVEIEIESEDTKDNITAYFQHDATQTPIVVEGNRRDTQFFNIGIGSSFVFRNGKSGYLFYETRAQHDYVTQHSLKIGMRLEF